MSKLESFFHGAKAEPHHPVLRYLDSAKPDQVTVEVSYPKELLGFKPARLFLHVVQDGREPTLQEYEWDDDLNTVLVERGIKAISVDNEKIRFCLSLRFAFRKAVTRYGDGFFNAVLGVFIRESEFKDFSEVADILKDVHTLPPDRNGSNSYEDCLELIDQAIRKQAQDLKDRLHYSQPQAAEILAGAVACYLDERFTVSDRRRLGWT